MDSTQLKKLKAQGKHLRPILSVGKQGLTEGSLELIRRELKQKKLIKIKFLKAAKEQWTLASLKERIVAETGCEVVEAVGNILLLYKR